MNLSDSRILRKPPLRMTGGCVLFRTLIAAITITTITVPMIIIVIVWHLSHKIALPPYRRRVRTAGKITISRLTSCICCMPLQMLLVLRMMIPICNTATGGAATTPYHLLFTTYHRCTFSPGEVGSFAVFCACDFSILSKQRWMPLVPRRIKSTSSPVRASSIFVMFCRNVMS